MAVTATANQRSEHQEIINKSIDDLDDVLKEINKKVGSQPHLAI
jgi:hypothetical protein